MAEKFMRQTNGGEVRELKIGQSFFFKSGSGGGGNPRNRRQPTFHTIKYDFKPESTKTSSAGSMDVDSDNRVNVQIPHDGGGQTNFSGHQKEANTKECILIFDEETGEFTLEKLSSQIMLKKTRPEKGDKAAGLPPPMAGAPAMVAGSSSSMASPSAAAPPPSPALTAPAEPRQGATPGLQFSGSRPHTPVNGFKQNGNGPAAGRPGSPYVSSGSPGIIVLPTSAPTNQEPCQPNPSSTSATTSSSWAAAKNGSKPKTKHVSKFPSADLLSSDSSSSSSGSSSDSDSNSEERPKFPQRQVSPPNPAHSPMSRSPMATSGAMAARSPMALSRGLNSPSGPHQAPPLPTPGPQGMPLILESSNGCVSGGNRGVGGQAGVRDRLSSFDSEEDDDDDDDDDFEDVGPRSSNGSSRNNALSLSSSSAPPHRQQKHQQPMDQRSLVPSTTAAGMPTLGGSSSTNVENPAQHLSMPHILNDDLELSESDSD